MWLQQRGSLPTFHHLPCTTTTFEPVRTGRARACANRPRRSSTGAALRTCRAWGRSTCCSQPTSSLGWTTQVRRRSDPEGLSSSAGQLFLRAESRGGRCEEERRARSEAGPTARRPRAESARSRDVTAALVGALRALAGEETLVLFAHMVCPISTEIVFWEEVQRRVDGGWGGHCRVPTTDNALSLKWAPRASLSGRRCRPCCAGGSRSRSSPGRSAATRLRVQAQWGTAPPMATAQPRQGNRLRARETDKLRRRTSEGIPTRTWGCAGALPSSVAHAKPLVLYGLPSSPREAHARRWRATGVSPSSEACHRGRGEEGCAPVAHVRCHSRSQAAWAPSHRAVITRTVSLGSAAPRCERRLAPFEVILEGVSPVVFRVLRTAPGVKLLIDGPWKSDAAVTE